MPFCELPYVDAVGVGSEQVEAISEVRGADGSRGNAIPLRRPPDRGQAFEDLLEGRTIVDREQPWHILDEQHRRSTVADDPPDVRPEPSLVTDAGASTSHGCRLTGEPRSDDIHDSAPRCAVEGCEIVPDRKRIQRFFFHSRHEGGCNVGLPFDSAYNATGTDGEVESALESEQAGAECDGAQRFGTCSHIHDLTFPP